MLTQLKLYGQILNSFVRQFTDLSAYCVIRIL